MTASSTVSANKKFDRDTGAQARTHLAKIAVAGAPAPSIDKKKAKKPKIQKETGALKAPKALRAPKAPKTPKQPKTAKEPKTIAKDDSASASREIAAASPPRKKKAQPSKKKATEDEEGDDESDLSENEDAVFAEEDDDKMGESEEEDKATQSDEEGEQLSKAKSKKEAKQQAITIAADAGTEACVVALADICGTEKEEVATTDEGTRRGSMTALKRFRPRAPIRIGKTSHRPTKRIASAAASALKRGSTIALARMRVQAKRAIYDVQKDTLSEASRTAAASAGAKELRKLLPVSGIRQDAVETLRRIMVCFYVDAYRRANLVRYQRGKSGISLDDVQLACVDLAR